MQKCGEPNQIWTYDNSTGNICTYQGGCLAAWRPDASCLASWRSDCRPQVAMIYAGKENPMSWPRLSFDFATSEIATPSTEKTAGSNLAGAFSLRGNYGAMLLDPTHLDEPAAVGVADNGTPQNNCTSNPRFKPWHRTVLHSAACAVNFHFESLIFTDTPHIVLHSALSRPPCGFPSLLLTSISTPHQLRGCISIIIQ